MILLSCLVLAIALMSWGIGQLRGDLLSRGVLKCFLFPALIPDVIARTITCLATATPIRGLSPWKRRPRLMNPYCRLHSWKR